ncbi:hypothetical protein SKAU_G00221970 [Synaphobranchus kaupii]|uniref:Uncharacterized protein n=1 Tax=Synaphobranchus kaupii TaxID=118154 RepID=A0A9Q1ITX9_SYNKA|nr:hypothetical protein SKAU_G00221970 [Synaphobranchus kaupii]
MSLWDPAEAVDQMRTLAASQWEKIGKAETSVLCNNCKEDKTRINQEDWYLDVNSQTGDPIRPLTFSHLDQLTGTLYLDWSEAQADRSAVLRLGENTQESCGRRRSRGGGVGFKSCPARRSLVISADRLLDSKGQGQGAILTVS